MKIVDNRNPVGAGRTFQDVTIYPFHDQDDEDSNSTHYIRVIIGQAVWVNVELPLMGISAHGAQALADAWAEAARLAILLSNNPNISIKG